MFVYRPSSIITLYMYTRAYKKLRNLGNKTVMPLWGFAKWCPSDSDVAVISGNYNEIEKGWIKPLIL